MLSQPGGLYGGQGLHGGQGLYGGQGLFSGQSLYGGQSLHGGQGLYGHGLYGGSQGLLGPIMMEPNPFQQSILGAHSSAMLGPTVIEAPIVGSPYISQQQLIGQTMMGSPYIQPQSVLGQPMVSQPMVSQPLVQPSMYPQQYLGSPMGSSVYGQQLLGSSLVEMPVGDTLDGFGQGYPSQVLMDENDGKEKVVSTRRMNSNVQSGIQQFGQGNINLQGNIQQVGQSSSHFQHLNSVAQPQSDQDQGKNQLQQGINSQSNTGSPANSAVNSSPSHIIANKKVQGFLKQIIAKRQEDALAKKAQTSSLNDATPLERSTLSRSTLNVNQRPLNDQILMNDQNSAEAEFTRRHVNYNLL